MKTLIVEDDSISRIILNTTLKGFGPTTLLASGKDAAALVSQAWEAGEPYDLITLDIMMPELDGQTALRQIRDAERSQGAADRRAKIVMTTALDDQKNQFAAWEGRCDGYLVKPIRTASLVALLGTLGLL